MWSSQSTFLDLFRILSLPIFYSFFSFYFTKLFIFYFKKKKSTKTGNTPRYFGTLKFLHQLWPLGYPQSIAAMATVTRLHIFPQRLEHLSFKDHGRTGQPVVLGPGLCQTGLGRRRGRDGLCLKQCRSFRTGEGGGAEEKEVESARKCGNLKETEAKLQRVSGFWSSLKTTILGSFSLAHGDEYSNALAKVEEVFSSVSF